MKKMLLLLVAVLLLTACGQGNEKDREAVYLNITAEEAKQIIRMNGKTSAFNPGMKVNTLFPSL